MMAREMQQLGLLSSPARLLSNIQAIRVRARASCQDLTISVVKVILTGLLFLMQMVSMIPKAFHGFWMLKIKIALI